MDGIIIPAPIVRFVREGLLGELGGAAALIAEASMTYEKEKHPERFVGPRGHFNAFAGLLDVIGWGDDPEGREGDFEVDLLRHGWALVKGLWFARKNQHIFEEDDATEEQRAAASRNIEDIEAFLADPRLVGSPAVERVSSRSFTDPAGIERALVAVLVGEERAVWWTRADIEGELHDMEALAVNEALERLRATGVVTVEGERVEASICARHLEGLGMIAV